MKSVGVSEATSWGETHVVSRAVCCIIIAASIALTACNDDAKSQSATQNDSNHSHAHAGDNHSHTTHSGHHDEWHTTIPEAVAVESGIETSVAGAREILSTTRVLGRVVPSEHRIAHVIPRYSGIVRDSRKHIGDAVEKNEVVAIIESNQSLQPFEVRSQIAGTVLQGHVVVGEFVPENQWIYVIGDLSEVWVDFAVPLLGESELAEGQTVIVSPSSVKTTTGRGVGANGLRREAKISYIAPYADEHTQSRLLRVVMHNKDLTFLPGMHVEGEVVTQRYQAPVAVHVGALQRIEDKTVVFVKQGERYEGKIVTVGRNQGDWVEIVSGLQPGEPYVSKHSFLIKSDILKASAEHDH